MPVNRMTMFKFADEKDIPEAIDKYYTLHSDAKKVPHNRREHQEGDKSD